jgi:hypothetical protein
MWRDLRTYPSHGDGKHRFGGRILFCKTADFGGLYWHQSLFWWRTGTNIQLGLLFLFLRPFDNPHFTIGDDFRKISFSIAAYFANLRRPA